MLFRSYSARANICSIRLGGLDNRNWSPPVQDKGVTGLVSSVASVLGLQVASSPCVLTGSSCCETVLISFYKDMSHIALMPNSNVLILT